MRNEKIFWPYQIFQEQNIAPIQTLEREKESEAMAILEKMISNSKKHITEVKRYIGAIPEDYPGFKNASIINFLMGVETLKKVDRNPDVFYGERPVKIDQEIKDAILERPIEMFDSISN